MAVVLCLDTKYSYIIVPIVDNFTYNDTFKVCFIVELFLTLW